MTAYIDADTCDDCGPCSGCGRHWCPREETSPGEADGLCVTCYETDDPENGAS